MSDGHLSRSELIRWRDEGGAREGIVTHLAGCAACREIAADLERDRPVDAEPQRFHAEDFAPTGYRIGSPQTRKSSWTSRLIYVAAAAGIVLAVVYLPAWLRERSESALRGGEVPVVLVQPVDQAVFVQDLVFDWKAGPGVDRFRLFVVAIDNPAKPIIEREVAGLRYEPTEEERSRIRPGSELHWFIEYRDGTATVTSPAARFRLR